ncbi:MAG: hypothetical protein V4540_09470 [Pseudomonadota bacterium]
MSMSAAALNISPDRWLDCPMPTGLQQRRRLAATAVVAEDLAWRVQPTKKGQAIDSPAL